MKRGILFDADGVLLDSADCHRAYWSEWASMHGLDWDVVWHATHGKRWIDTIAIAAPHLDLSEQLEVLAGLCGESWRSVRLYAGVPELLHELPGSQWGIVTSGSRNAVTQILLAHDVVVPAVLVEGEDVPRGKPEPHCYRLGAELLGVDPSDALAVEDAPDGVLAARDAGMRVLAVATTHASPALEAADLVRADLLSARDDIVDWLNT